MKNYPGGSRNFHKNPIVKLALNRQESANAIGVSVNTFDQMVEAGIFSPARLFGRRQFWLIADLESGIGDLPTKEEKKWKAS